MNPNPDRYQIAVAIIICHLVLIGTLVALLISDALLQEEFTPLLTLFSPITAIYSGSVFQYLSDRIRAKPDDLPETSLPHANLIKRLIFGHFAAMLFLLTGKAVFNWLDFPTMTILMTVLETSFGGYLGIVMSAVFGKK